MNARNYSFCLIALAMPLHCSMMIGRLFPHLHTIIITLHNANSIAVMVACAIYHDQLIDDIHPAMPPAPHEFSMKLQSSF